MKDALDSDEAIDALEKALDQQQQHIRDLVETAYKEGWETGRNGGTSFPMFEQDWKNSRTLAKLKSEENGDELQNIVNLTERVKTLECLLNRVWINQAGSNLPAGLIVDIGKALGLNIGQDDFRD